MGTSRRGGEAACTIRTPPALRRRPADVPGQGRRSPEGCSVGRSSYATWLKNLDPCPPDSARHLVSQSPSTGGLGVELREHIRLMYTDPPARRTKAPASPDRELLGSRRSHSALVRCGRVDRAARSLIAIAESGSRRHCACSSFGFLEAFRFTASAQIMTILISTGAGSRPSCERSTTAGTFPFASGFLQAEAFERWRAASRSGPG